MTHIPDESEKILADQIAANDKRTNNKAALDLLFMEDDLTTQMMIKQILRGQNVNLEFATNAQQGLEMYSNKPPHIVFLDINMPGRMDGLQVLDVLNRCDPCVFAMMLTSSAVGEHVTTAIKNNVQGYVIKPFTMNKLMECINRYRRMVLEQVV